MQGARPPKGKLPPGVEFISGAYYVRFRDGHGKRVRRVCTARTVKEAVALRDEERTRGYRQRKGLDPLPGSSSLTMAKGTRWWLDNICPQRSRKVDGLQLGKHVIRNPALGPLGAGAVSAEVLTAYFKQMHETDDYSAATVNKVRSKLFSIFEAMRRHKPPLFVGANPVADTQPLPVLKKKHTVLEPEQVDRLLRHVPARWRDYFACALYTGIRKGELSGLEKTRVDLRHKLIEVARSYDWDTTKGGHADGLPIADALVPYLEHALASSPVTSPYVFPALDGGMRTEHDNPEKILRSALGRAGIVSGYRFNCRPCNKGWKAAGRERVFEYHPDDKDRRCKACRAKLISTPVPLGMVFHDLRHSCITMLIRAKAPWPQIQKIARHANITTTLGTYGHLDVEDLRGAINSIAAPTPATGGPATKDAMIEAAMQMLAEAHALPSTAPDASTSHGSGQPAVKALKVVK